jgi:hypothetical protein
MFRVMVGTTGAWVAMAAIAATPAAAAPEPKEVAMHSNGLGVCVSQLAIMPELIGFERLGQDVSNLARSRTLLEAIKTVRSPQCGHPPGPGHLP